MESLTILIQRVSPGYILGLSKCGVGYKFLTTGEDIYRQGTTVEIFVHEEISIHHNNRIKIERFGFLNELSRELFIFLLQIKGVGPKVALVLMERFGGARRLAEILYRKDELTLATACKKYADVLMNAASKPSGEAIISRILGGMGERTIRSRVYGDLVAMDHDPQKCMEEMDRMEEELLKKGVQGGLEGCGFEEVFRRMLGRLSGV